MVVPVEYASRRIGGVPVTPPVRGGSGRFYWTMVDALVGESPQGQAVTGQAPQAGTVVGSVVGPGTLSAINDFYKDWWLVVSSASPGNGNVYRAARVSNYVGATQTLTIDQPWDLAAETSFDLILPYKVSLENDIAEDLVLSSNVELHLEGHKVKGKADVSATFVSIRDGWITNGIQHTVAGYLRLKNIDASRRNGTIYALLLTEGSNLGRCSADGCSFYGRVAGRRGKMGWEIQGCRNYGVADTVNGVPYALVESPSGGAAVVVTQFDAFINEIGRAHV